MKQPAFWMAVLAASLCAARAQVDVQVVMDQTEFLAAESVPVAVRVVIILARRCILARRTGSVIPWNRRTD